MAEIPGVFNQPTAAFVLLPDGIKFPPIEKEWQRKPHTFSEAEIHKGNVGVLAGNGYIGLDQDDPAAFDGLELPITTKWETRPGRAGMWFRCNDRTPEVLAKYGKKADQAQLKLYKDGKPVGEVKLGRAYQVIPPSWKTLEDGTRADYRLLQETPPAEISLEKLLSDLQAIGITFSSKLEANVAKLEGMAKESRKRRAETDEQRTRRYAEAALRGEVEKVRSAPVGQRNEQLNDSAFALGQLVAAGALSESEVVQALASVAADGEPGKIPRTIASGIEAGMRHPREIPAPSRMEDALPMRTISLDDPLGAVGLDDDGTIKMVECDKEGRKMLVWLSDCAVYIHTETSARDSTEFIFKGVGAKDRRSVSFALPAITLADPGKFRAALINAFGARNRVGKLGFETVQRLTRSVRLMKRVEVPAWDGNIPLVPGVDLASGVEYRLGAYTPAEVRAGDIETAKGRLRTLMRSHEYSPILVAVVLGAPAFARWHPNDRFGLGLWGESGSFKTTIAQLALAMFGEGYADDAALLKHGNAGTTIVGATTIFAFAGMLAQILDDVKTTNPKDSQSYVSLIHAVIEGKDKARGNKDGTLRDSKEFLCTPIITGEIRPEEASTTARVLNLVWSKAACNKDALTDVETHVSDLSIIGYHWLRFLAGSELNLVDGFNEARSKKFQEFSSKRYVNPGRLATIYTLVRSAWGLLRASPLGDVFDEFSSPFVESLDRAIEVQGQAVTGETELEKFMSGLREILASRPGIVQSLQGVTVLGSVIGKWTENGLFLLPTETLNELNKIRAFTQQPTVSSMTAALNAAGYLVTDGRHLKKRVSLNGSQVRGWLIGPTSGIARPPCGLPETSDGEAHKTTKTTKTTPDEQENFSENFKKNHVRSVDEKDAHNSSGLSGLSGLVEERDREIDIDFDGTNDKTTHKTTASVSGLPSGRGEEQPGIGPHPRKDEPTPGNFVCHLAKLRAAAIMEYGMAGWDDPVKLSLAIGLPVCLIMRGLDHLGYERYERAGGGVGYRQQVAEA
ncbi:MAG: hypothetical protein A4E48_00447 [Methanosaeta sp. PtaU1.Bin060]|nr:MAG: hypothetical protein A4E48_00447 [Methanosaeta sp. PtaU1.Bin060]